MEGFGLITETRRPNYGARRSGITRVILAAIGILGLAGCSEKKEIPLAGEPVMVRDNATITNCTATNRPVDANRKTGASNGVLWDGRDK